MRKNRKKSDAHLDRYKPPNNGCFECKRHKGKSPYSSIFPYNLSVAVSFFQNPAAKDPGCYSKTLTNRMAFAKVHELSLSRQPSNPLNPPNPPNLPNPLNLRGYHVCGKGSPEAVPPSPSARISMSVALPRGSARPASGRTPTLPTLTRNTGSPSARQSRAVRRPFSRSQTSRLEGLLNGCSRSVTLTASKRVVKKTRRETA